MANNQISPIILFCYNRADKVREALNHLAKNTLAKESDLFIFCDGPRNEKDLAKVKEVHQVLDSITGFKSINIEKRELNRGLANSVIYGVSKVLDLYESAIILEDDIIVAEGFLSFMNQALEFYKNDPEIFSITGFNFPDTISKFPGNYDKDIFFVKGRNSSWSWGIWRDRWKKIDFVMADYNEFANNPEKQKSFCASGDDLAAMLKAQMLGKVDSWSIRVAYHTWKYGLYTVFPVKTLIKNIGFDQSGAHGDGNKRMYEFEIENNINKQFNFEHLNAIKNNDIAQSYYIRHYKKKFFKFSDKTRRKLTYFALGFIVCELINLLLK